MHSTPVESNESTPNTHEAPHYTKPAVFILMDAQVPAEALCQESSLLEVSSPHLGRKRSLLEEEMATSADPMRPTTSAKLKSKKQRLSAPATGIRRSTQKVPDKQIFKWESMESTTKGTGHWKGYLEVRADGAILDGSGNAVGQVGPAL